MKTAAAKTATTNVGFVPEYTVTTNSKANKEKVASLPTQAQIVLKTIGKRTLSYAALIEALAKSELKTVQGPARIWAFYKSRLLREKLIVIGDAKTA